MRKYQKTGLPRGRRKGSFGNYKNVVNYNRSQKACLERDNYTCQMCGSRKRLDVHHRDNKGHIIANYGADDSLGNLWTLCHRCHIRLHFQSDVKEQIILTRREQGETFQSIALTFGVSRQRIHQIYLRITG